jgi:hypothetical protein
VQELCAGACYLEEKMVMESDTMDITDTLEFEYTLRVAY